MNGAYRACCRSSVKTHQLRFESDRKESRSQEIIDHSASAGMMRRPYKSEPQTAERVIHETAPNLFGEAGGVRYAYRRFGAHSETP
jgi:hypothetical protein